MDRIAVKYNSAVLFPAFIHEYLGNEVENLAEHNIDFYNYIENTEKILNIDLSDFNISTNNYLDNEYKNQVLTYIFCCCYSDALKIKEFKADVIAGVSMGIYAALYHARAISFQDGLKLVSSAYELANSAVGSRKFAMASIIGLEKKDIVAILFSLNANVEIANCNGEHSYLLVGNETDLKAVTNACKEEGALHVVTFNAHCPYHTSHMQQPSEAFSRLVSEIPVFKPDTPLISSINQQLIEDETSVKNELAINLVTPINWYKSMQVMIHSGINKMIECGPGNSLYKIGKFIEGDFKIYPANKLYKIGL